MALTLSTVQKCTLTVAPVDILGNPAVVDGPISWSISDESICKLTQVSETEAVVETVGVPGVVQVTVSADARLGEEVKLIFGTLDITVVPAEAVGFAIATGVPEDRTL